jgi:hypothetical protein
MCWLDEWLTISLSSYSETIVVFMGRWTR